MPTRVAAAMPASTRKQEAGTPKDASSSAKSSTATRPEKQVATATRQAVTRRAVPSGDTASKSAARTRAATTASRSAGQSSATSNALPAAGARKDAQARGEASDRVAAILRDIATPARCTKQSVKDLQAILGEQDQRFSTRSVRAAKQTVNAVIESTNKLAVDGWLASCSQNTSTRTSKGSTSAQKGNQIAEANVIAQLQLFRVAVEYLRKAAQDVEEWGVKSDDLTPILLSVARKAVALQLYEQAISILSFSISEVFRLVHDDEEPLFCIVIPTEQVSPAIHVQVLDAQALLWTCSVATTRDKGQIKGAVAKLEDDPSGPCAWQKWVRSAVDLSSEEVKAADRALYTLEKSVTRLLTPVPKDGDALQPTEAEWTLACRMTSLKLLLLASNVDTKSIWDRLARIGASYMRAATTNANEKVRTAAFDLVHAAFRDFVVRFEQDDLQLGKEALKGEDFQTFCAHWLVLAQKADDIAAVQHISNTRNRTLNQLTRPVPSPHGGIELLLSRDVASTFSIANAPTILTIAAICLSKASQSRKFDKAQVEEGTTMLQTLQARWATLEGNQRQAIEKEMPNLKRQSMLLLEKTIDTSKSGESDLRLYMLTEAIADFFGVMLDASLKEKHDAKSLQPVDLLRSCVQIKRMLARQIFATESDCSKSKTFNLLQSAREIAASGTGKAWEDMHQDRAEVLRLVASSWHNCGSQLYNDKKAQYAVRFLRGAAESAELSNELYRQTAKDGVTEEEKNVRLAQEQSLTKKWEHVAICCRQTNQREAAEECYIKSILCFPSSAWCAVVEDAARMPSSKVLMERESAAEEQSKIRREIGDVVRSVFEMQVYELLSFSNAHRNFLSRLTQGGMSPEILMVLRDYCLDTMENTMHREEAPAVALSLIADQLEYQKIDKYPLRRAQTLLRKLELLMLMPSLGESKDDIHLLQANIHNILLRDDGWAMDHALAQFKAQLTANFRLLCVAQLQISHSDIDREELRLQTKQLETALGDLPNDKDFVRAVDAKATERKALRKIVAARQIKQEVEPRTPAAKKPAFTRSGITITPGSKDVPLIKSTNGDWNVLSFSLLGLVCEGILAHGNTLAAIKLLHTALRAVGRLQSSNAHSLEIRLRAHIGRQQLQSGQLQKATATAHLLKELTSGEKEDMSFDEKSLCISQLFLAECAYENNSQDIATQHLSEIRNILDRIDKNKKSNSWRNVLERCQMTEIRAACEAVQASVSFMSGDLVNAIRCAVCSVREALKAGSIFAHLCGHKSHREEDPFEHRTQSGSLYNATSSQKGDRRCRDLPDFASIQLATLSWRLMKTTMEAYTVAIRLYVRRGSAKDAEVLATEAIAFASKANCALMTSSAHIERASVRLASNQIGLAAEDIAQASKFRGEDEDRLYRVMMSIVLGDQAARTGLYEKAIQYYQESLHGLQALQSSFERLEEFIETPRATRSSKRLPGRKSLDRDCLFPRLRSKILSRTASLLYRTGQTKMGFQMFEDLSTSTPFHPLHGDALVSHGELILREAWSALKSDPNYSTTLEAVHWVPLSIVLEKGTATRKSLATGQSARDAAQQAFHKALQLFRQVIDSEWTPLSDSITARLGKMHSALALISRSRLTKEETSTAKQIAEQISFLLETSMSITLDRELLDAIQAKSDRHDVSASINTPRTTTGAISPTRMSSNPPRLIAQWGKYQSEGGDLDTGADSSRDLQLWLDARQRRLDVCSQARTFCLPKGYIVVSISFSSERNSLLITRRENRGDQKSQQPKVIILPIDRQSRQEGDENALRAEEAQTELKAIIEESNVATQGAQHLDDLTARKDWWTRRRKLDNRLRDLLKCIETTWFGLFKGLLLPTPSFTDESRQIFTEAIKNLASRAYTSGTTQKHTTTIDISEQVIDCLAALNPALCSDEELEDFIHFILDSCQSQGLPVAVDEVELDVYVTELRSAIESHHARQLAANRNHHDEKFDPHVFLILDKETSAFPWESLPSVRGTAICRIPSMHFLQDRVAAMHDERFIVNPSTAKLWYLLNPSKDLTRTQARFQPHFSSCPAKSSSARDGQALTNSIRQHSWRGIAGRAPSMDEYANALECNDLVLYFGHGGAEQYIRPSRLRSMKKCAVTMLWGCSSGVLQDLGDFDRTGTPHNYLLAGCPSLVANLWDATDKELDGISESVLSLMGIIEPTAEQSPTKSSGAISGRTCASLSRVPPSSSSSEDDAQKHLKTHEGVPRPISVARAVAESRDACKLPYLSGATCVVYGVPAYFIP